MGRAKGGWTGTFPVPATIPSKSLMFLPSNPFLSIHLSINPYPSYFVPQHHLTTVQYCNSGQAHRSLRKTRRWYSRTGDGTLPLAFNALSSRDCGVD